MKWRLCGVDMLGELASTWDGINGAFSRLPILDARFFELLLHEKKLKDARLALCESGSEPVAAAIVVPTKLGSWQTFQPSQAPLGPWVQRPEVPTGELLASLTRALPSSTMVLSATQLDPDMLPRPAADSLATMDYIETARLTLSGTFDDFWETRSKNLRKNVKRQRNRLAREEVTTRYERLSAPDDVGRGVDEYGLMESRGWKAAEGTALHPDNFQGRFYRQLFEERAAEGEAFVARLYYNDLVVAADLYLERDGVLILLKTTYDESQTTTSPSSLLREESLRAFFEHEEYQRIEFYGRVMDWHRKWTDELRVLYHTNYYRSSIAGKVLSLKQQLLS